MIFNKTVRNTLTASGEKTVVDAIGYDEVETTVGRSKTSYGLTTNISQNLQFTGLGRDILLNERYKNGIESPVEFTRENLNNSTYELLSEGLLDLSTLNNTKTTATADFIEGKFDEILKNNSREKFELNRNTSIDGTNIGELQTSLMSWKGKKIFLRTDFNTEPYQENIVEPNFSKRIAVITPKMKADPVSDEDSQSVLSHYFNPLDTTVSVANVFHFDAARPKLLNLEIDVDIDFINDSGITTSLYLGVSSDGDQFTTVEDIELIGESSSTSLVYQGSMEIEMEIGYSLSLYAVCDYNEETVGVVTNKCSVIQTEDSFYEPINPEDRFVEGITLYQAFERILKILDPTAVFKSDYIASKWNDVFLTSGGTIRHLQIDGEKVPTLTTSFEDLMKFAFTLEPMAFNTKKKGNRTVLEVESIDYFFGGEQLGFNFFEGSKYLNIGTLSDIERKVATDFIWSRIEIGSNVSGDIEDVFGLQAFNTRNIYLNPFTRIDNTYDATNEYRYDPNEAELCYRKQYSEYPDTDTQYDDNVFAFDCYKGSSTYIVNEFSTHFTTVTGIYSPETGYNYRFSPMNCLLRHTKFLGTELNKSVYQDKSLRYSSTNGNVQLETKPISGMARKENDNVLVSDFEPSIIGSDIIEGKTALTIDLYKQITGGNPIPNFIKKVRFINENGTEEEAFFLTAKMKDDLTVELISR